MRRKRRCPPDDGLICTAAIHWGIPRGKQAILNRLLNREKLDVLFDAARKGHLPADFRQWDRADNQGYTVAHAAAYSGRLPPDFDQWDLAGDDGWTVAHVAARAGTLPAGFDRWELADKRGVTVAQAAKATCHFSAGFIFPQKVTAQETGLIESTAGQ